MVWNAVKVGIETIIFALNKTADIGINTKRIHLVWRIELT